MGIGWRLWRKDLCKVLKNEKKNNVDGGEVKITFREKRDDEKKVLKIGWKRKKGKMNKERELIMSVENIYIWRKKKCKMELIEKLKKIRKPKILVFDSSMWEIIWMKTRLKLKQFDAEKNTSWKKERWVFNRRKKEMWDEKLEQIWRKKIEKKLRIKMVWVDEEKKGRV